MRPPVTIPVLIMMIASCQGPATGDVKEGNPFFPGLNEPVPYARVTPEQVTAYGRITARETEAALERIRSEESPGFENVFMEYDRVISELNKAANNCFMLYWVSPDSLVRTKGLESYQVLDSLATGITSDPGLYRQMTAFAGSEACGELTGHRKLFVDDVIRLFEHEGVNLEAEKLVRFRQLKAEITELSSSYSIHMNNANEVLVLDEAGASGIPEKFLEAYRRDSLYEIPVIPATRGPVLNNASSEKTRKSYLVKYQNRAWEENLKILDELVRKRHELALLMGFRSYASYTTTMKMAKNPETVWRFIEDLVDRTREKAFMDQELLKQYRNRVTGTASRAPVNPWDVRYYRNQLLISEHHVDHERIREYLPLEGCISGMLEIYGGLLGLEFRKVEHPSVWHEEVMMYQVLEEGKVTGRFYLDLYPRPGKESWFYGVDLTPGRLTAEGYEIPVCMLLANFPRPTETTPSLLSHDELSTLFHEFGHIMDRMSYTGEFASQAGSKEDFVEAMAQIFENWIWDYDILSTFARHYETGEVLPRELFDNMLNAKNITSGLDAQGSLRNSLYDMMLYDRYDPEHPLDGDELWREVDRQMALPMYIEGTHPQASWIHINTHPTYYYGYLWSEVFAQDMFTVFEKRGLTDTASGVRYRRLILSNGTQRDIVEAVEEFLGRPWSNEAYIRSLGLN
jgi:thimet oligopeptidase